MYVEYFVNQLTIMDLCDIFLKKKGKDREGNSH